MTKSKVLTAVLAAVLAAAMMAGCTAMAGGGQRPDERPGQEGGGEHGPGGENGSENGNEGGEEGGTSLTPDETFDQVRKGVRLIMRYEAGQEAFVGMVKNTTRATLPQVRVEVHLSNGTELGPTTPQDLAAGKSRPVRLVAAGESFTGWTPHAEVGPKSGPGGEGGGS